MSAFILSIYLLWMINLYIIKSWLHLFMIALSNDVCIYILDVYILWMIYLYIVLLNDACTYTINIYFMILLYIYIIQSCHFFIDYFIVTACILSIYTYYEWFVYISLHHVCMIALHMYIDYLIMRLLILSLYISWLLY